MRQDNAFYLEERLFQNIEGTDAKETLAFSPINHHMKRFFGFDALRLNICQKAFCERIMQSRDVFPRFMKDIIT